MSNYKLKPEVANFIIEQKKLNAMLSCRKLVPLVTEKFKIAISKSLINKVIKEANLSNRVGRIRNREKTPEFIQNGGFIFLKAADIKLGITTSLTDSFSIYFPDKKLNALQKMNEILTYMQFFEFSQLAPGKHNYRKLGLWWLLEGVISKDSLLDFYQRLNLIPIPEANAILKKININHNIIIFNELYNNCLCQLNAYVQKNFFPPGYQFLDPFAMKERFYRLPANIERKPHLIKIQLFYPPEFFWVNDVVWQEGFSHAANKVNEAGIFNEYGEQIWINSSACFSYENVSYFR